MVEGSLTVSDSTPSQGDVIGVAGTGYLAGSEVELTLESTTTDAILLVAATTDASGSFEVDVEIPDVADGIYTVRGVGDAPGGGILNLTAQVNIGNQLPFTGSRVGIPVLILAAAFVATGVGVLAYTRRVNGPTEDPRPPTSD